MLDVTSFDIVIKFCCIDVFSLTLHNLCHIFAKEVTFSRLEKPRDYWLRQLSRPRNILFENLNSLVVRVLLYSAAWLSWGHIKSVNVNILHKIGTQVDWDHLCFHLKSFFKNLLYLTYIISIQRLEGTILVFGDNVMNYWQKPISW